MSGVSLLYFDVEEDLRSAVRALLQDRCDTATVAGLYDGGPGPEGLWKVLAGELGLAGLLVPEDLGGAGASAREAAVVLEETGRAVAPVPYLTSSVVASTLLVAARSSLVRELASGERTAAVVLPWSSAPHATVPAVSVTDGLLTGTVRSVAGALGAGLLLVPVTCADGVAVYAVEARAAKVAAVASLDMTRPVADVTLTEAPGELLASGSAGETAVRHALLTGAGLLASEQVGVAQWCLDTTLAYLKERRQFGRAVGGFQAIKHRMADVYVEVESGLAAARYAAGTLAEQDQDAATAVAVAQAYCSDAAVHAAEEAVQLHGGIAMTWEHPVHLFLKRAKADQLALGTPGQHRARLAGLVDLPPAPPQPEGRR